MPDIEWVLLYLLLGVIVGFMAGLLGAGGGGILVPMLTSIFIQQGISLDHVVHLALGTALAAMVVSSYSSIRVNSSRGAIVWKAVSGLAPGIILGALVTTHIAASLTSAYIAIFFTIFMALLAAQMFFNWNPKPSIKPVEVKGMLLAGAGIGSVSALAAVGGGFLTVAYLTYKNVELKKAIGTAVAIGLPIAVAGTLGYMISGWSTTSNIPYAIGFIYLPAFLSISLSSYLAVPYGVRLSHSLPEQLLKKILAIVALVLGIKMLISVIQF